MRTLVSRYPGFCQICHAEIPRGTQITDGRGAGWSHATCPTQAPTAPAPSPAPAGDAAAAAYAAAVVAARPRRRNAKPASCGRCGLGLDSGEGHLYRCLGSDSGCMLHYDNESGAWHVDCVDEAACKARRTEAQEWARVENAPLREQEIKSIRRVIKNVTARAALAKATGVS